MQVVVSQLCFRYWARSSQKQMLALTTNIVSSGDIDPGTKEYIDRLYDILQVKKKVRPLLWGVVRKKANNKVDLASKLDVVTRAIAEGFLVYKLGDVVPPSHPDYQEHNHEFTDLFLGFEFKKTGMYEQALCGGPIQMWETLVMLHGILGQFQNISVSTLANHFADTDIDVDNSKRYRQMARIHQHMGISTKDYDALCGIMKRVMQRIVAHPIIEVQEQETLVDFFMARFDTDLTRSTCVLPNSDAVSAVTVAY